MTPYRQEHGNNVSKKSENKTISFYESSKPHDLFFKRIFSEFPEVAKELMQSYLPTELTQHLDVAKFELCNHEMFSPTGASRIADVVVKTSIKNTDDNAYLVLFAFEHQSTNDPLMAFRILQYIMLILDSYIKEQEGQGVARSKIKLPLVYPAVFYHGRSPATFTNNIADLVSAPKELVANVFLQPFKLVDFTKIDDEELKAQNWAGLTGLCFKYIFKQTAEDLMRLLKLYEEIGEKSLKLKFIENNIDFIEMIAEYLIETANFDKKDAHDDIIKTSSKLTKDVEDNMGAIANNLIQQGMVQGMVQGERNVLLMLASQRFGALTDSQKKLLEALNADELLEASSKILDAKSFEDLFKKRS